MGYCVAFGVIGSMANFEGRDQGWNGQSDYYKTLLWLLSLENVDKILLFGYNDKEKFKELVREIDPNNKIIYAKDNGFHRPQYTNDKKPLKQPEHFQQAIEPAYKLIKSGIKPDFGLFFMSQGSTVASCIPHYLNTIKYPDRQASVLLMAANYTAPFCIYLSLAKFPYFLACTDPRYLQNNIYPRELAHPPIAILSQANAKHKWKRIQKFDESKITIEEDWESTYEGIEKIDLINTKINKSFYKNIRFSIISKQLESNNCLPKKDFRYMELKKWILDPKGSENSEIYGYWHESRINGDKRFKGYIKDTEELYSIMRKTKYTLVLPTKAGWATSKSYIVAGNGAFPFLHPNFDKQKNQNFPEYCRVNSPEEMYNKMNELDGNDEMYKYLMEEIWSEMEDGLDGSFFTKALNKKFTEKNIGIQL